jgi:thymidine phosphorylase
VPKKAMTPVTFSFNKMRSVVEQHGACLAWGGSLSLSPIDDIIIRIERALDLDSEGQLVASVISKKVAAGSTHVLIDIPVGPSAKVRTHLAVLRNQKNAPLAGIKMHVRLGDKVEEGQALLTLYAQAQGELEYALQFYYSHPEAIQIDKEIL